MQTIHSIHKFQNNGYFYRLCIYYTIIKKKFDTNQDLLTIISQLIYGLFLIVGNTQNIKHFTKLRRSLQTISFNAFQFRDILIFF